MRSSSGFKIACICICVSLVFGSIHPAYAGKAPEYETAEEQACADTEETSAEEPEDETEEVPAEEPEAEITEEVPAEEPEAEITEEVPAEEPEDLLLPEKGEEAAAEPEEHPEELIRAASAERGQSAAELGYVPGEILAVYDNGASDSDVAAAAAELDGEVSEVLDNGGSTVAVIDISEETTVEAAIAEYMEDPAVAYAEPNYILTPMDDGSSSGAALDYLSAIRASGERGAFSLLGNEYAGVRVGVIDTGFDIGNSAIAGKISSESVRITDAVGGCEALSGSGYAGHGTNVAGILAAAAGPSLSELVLVDASKNIQNTGSSGDIPELSVDYVISAINYLEDRVGIINISYGTDTSSSSLEQAVNSAYQKGVVIIASAGNSGAGSAVYPAAYSSTISVGASEGSGAAAAGSGTGDLYAPGVNISCADGSVHSETATSLSAAMVSAAAAMLRSVSPGISLVSIKDTLISAADSSGGVNVLDMAAAVSSVMGGAEDVVYLQASMADDSAVRNGIYTDTWAEKLVLSWKGGVLQRDIDYKIDESSITVSPNDDDTISLSVVLEGLAPSFSGRITVETSASKISTQDFTIVLRGNYALQGNQQIRPEVAVKYKEGFKALSEGTDYTLEYGSNNTAGANAGIIRVSGIGLYCGTEEILFDIFSPDEVIRTLQVEEDIICSVYADGTLVLSGTGEMYDKYTEDGGIEPSPLTDLTDLKGNSLIIRKVIVEEGITSLCSYCFYGFTELTEVVLPETLKEIRAYQFAGCTSLAGIVFPDSLETIGAAAFEGCDSLTSVVLPEHLRILGWNAFYNSGLTSIEIPEEVIWIGQGVFAFCGNLTSVSINARIDCIKDFLFEYCKSLKSFAIPDGVTSIGQNAFYGVNLESLTVPVSVAKIESQAFGSCEVYYQGTLDDWKKIDLAENAFNNYHLHTISEAALSGKCGENLTWILDDEGALTIVGTGEMEDYYNRTYGEEYYDAPWGKEITSVTVKEGVTSIGNGAFYGCSCLKKAELPDSMKSIGIWAFHGCTNLNEINLPEGLTELQEEAFFGCKSLSAITIPESLETVGIYVFAYCSGLSNAVVSEGITSIGAGMFFCCSGLKKVDIPETVSIIGGSAFEGCSGLETLTLPEGVKKISNYAFFECYALKEISLPEGLEEISEGSFMWCKSLVSVTLQQGIKKIGRSAFEGCSSLTEIGLPEGLMEIGVNAFYYCRALTEICIPEGVEELPEDVFGRCRRLREVSFPKSLRSIGNRAFEECGLQEIVIPENVTEIGENAFYGCSDLSEVQFSMILYRIGDKAFHGCALTEAVLPKGVNVTEENYTDYFDEEVKISFVKGSPECGEDAYYHFFEDGTLSIWGTGSIEAFWNGCYEWAEIKDKVKKIVIEEGITSTGNASFSHFSALKKVSLPDSLTEIGYNAFAYCGKLGKLVVPYKVEKIGSAAFYSCTGLKKIQFYCSEKDGQIPQLKAIEARTFYGCTSLKTINLGGLNNLKTIGGQAFCGCSSLKSGTLGESVVSIGDYAYYKCSALTRFHCKSALKKVGKAAFGYCTGLKYFSPGAMLEELGDMAFISCISLKSVGLRNTNTSLKRIGAYTFYNCIRLSHLDIPKSLEEIGEYAFYGSGIAVLPIHYDNVFSVVPDPKTGCLELPDTLKSIGKFAFAKCRKMQNMIIHSSDVEIGPYTFYGDSSLKTVELPESMKYLSTGMFAYCNKLKTPDPSDDYQLGQYVFAKTNDPVDYDDIKDLEANEIVVAEGVDCILKGLDDPTAVIRSSAPVIVSENDYSGGDHVLHANAPGTANVLYRASDGKLVKFHIEVVPPIEADLDGHYKEISEYTYSWYHETGSDDDEESKTTPEPDEGTKVTPEPEKETTVTPAPENETTVTPAPENEPTVVPVPESGTASTRSDTNMAADIPGRGSGASSPQTSGTANAAAGADGETVSDADRASTEDPSGTETAKTENEKQKTVTKEGPEEEMTAAANDTSAEDMKGGAEETGLSLTEKAGAAGGDASAVTENSGTAGIPKTAIVLIIAACACLAAILALKTASGRKRNKGN